MVTDEMGAMVWDQVFGPRVAHTRVAHTSRRLRCMRLFLRNMNGCRNVTDVERRDAPAEALLRREQSDRGWRRRLVCSVCVVPKGLVLVGREAYTAGPWRAESSIHSGRVAIHHLHHLSPHTGFQF
jgi:hypothetical protein